MRDQAIRNAYPYVVTIDNDTVAYDKDGNPKRDVNTYYPDVGMVYTQEMINQDLEERKSLDERIRKRIK